MRPIDADAMRQDWLENGENEHVYDTNAFLGSIDDQPTLDVEPVRHGRWEWYEEPYDSRNPDGVCGWRCSECKQDLANELTLGIPGMHYACAIIDDPDAQPTLKRCIFCGAKMDAKEE